MKNTGQLNERTLLEFCSLAYFLFVCIFGLSTCRSLVLLICLYFFFPSTLSTYSHFLLPFNWSFPPLIIPRTRPSVRPPLWPSVSPSIRTVPTPLQKLLSSVSSSLNRSVTGNFVCPLCLFARPSLRPSFRLSVRPFDHLFVRRSVSWPSLRPSLRSLLRPPVLPYFRSSVQPFNHSMI